LIGDPRLRLWAHQLGFDGHPLTKSRRYSVTFGYIRGERVTARRLELLRRNPCRIPDAGKGDSDERPVIPLPVVFDIAGRLPARYRALVLLATFAQMRLGELAACAAIASILTPARSASPKRWSSRTRAGSSPSRPSRAPGSALSPSPPRSCPTCESTWSATPSPAVAAWSSSGPKGGKIRRSNFNVIWSAACTGAGVPDAHFHDLRHTGGTLAATTGATPKELMTRLGHSSTRAAMIYQHATRDRDKAIAQALGTLADKARNGS
jgi:hypothetical protein